MTVNKVYCLFEQSGTFKNEFLKMGIPAFDFDISDEYGQTDSRVDLFKEIENAYENKNSIFDDILPGDLILAFFPCVYFCQYSQLLLTYDSYNYRSLSIREKTTKIIERQRVRQLYLERLTKLFCVVQERGLKMIVENPATSNYILQGQNFVAEPTFIDRNRSLRGDYFIKPTAYWFVNCEPTKLTSYMVNKQVRYIEKQRHGKVAGECSMERSIMSPTYAKNFICDFILGRVQLHTQLDLQL